MALVDSRVVTLSEMIAAPSARLDPHYFALFPRIAAIVDGIVDPVRLEPPAVLVANGLNLPEAAYDYAADDPPYRYASVTAISQYSFRTDRAVPLKDPDSFTYKTSLADAAVGPLDVLVTRSNAIAPGVAWPAAEAWAEGGPGIVPSGFVIRLKVDPNRLDPFYAAAVLNHPVWRMWTAALAAGKSQLNISQAQLADVCIPGVTRDLQDSLGGQYRQLLAAIATGLAAAEGFAARCDHLLANHAGLAVPPLRHSRLTVDHLRLSAVLCASEGMRIDARFHRGEVRQILALLDNQPTTTLRELIVGDLVKGSQPTLVSEDEATPFAGPRVVSTGCIQGGAVVPELTKLTTEECFDRAGVRQLSGGDVVLTMDGEGSIGKAATFSGDFDAVPDSHVAILRLADPTQAPAVVCVINSSLGQAQVDLSTTGSTGQTQISKADALGLRIPIVALKRSEALSQPFQDLTESFENAGASIRRLVCENAAALGQDLCASGAFTEPAAAAMTAISDPETLLAYLQRIKDVAT